jgi:hypothetical protein
VYAPCGADEHGRDTLRCLFREDVDYVIAAPGWRFSTALFEKDATPAMHENGKHPATRNGGYESVNIDGLYFAGTLMHGNDHKVSSGGFIHGFRYLCRALHRELEQVEVDDAAAVSTAEKRSTVVVGAHGDMTAAAADVKTLSWLEANERGISSPLTAHPPRSWPRTRIECGLRSLVAAFLRRINVAAGPVQMFGLLADVFLLSPLVLANVDLFTGVGPLAALYEPWSFPYPTAACAAASDIDEFAPPWLAQSSHELTAPNADEQAASDRALQRALRGVYFEEVPVGSVSQHVERRWALEESGATEDHEWITLTMEYGKAPKKQQKSEARATFNTQPDDGRTHFAEDYVRDPFALNRGTSNLRTPEDSHFLHPILRYYRSGAADAHIGHAAPQLLSELHIIEDAALDWSLFEPHCLHLARWLQDIGAKRLLAAASTHGLNVSFGPTAPASAARRASRFQPHARPALLDRVMQVPGTALYYRGAAVWGGTVGWFLGLSIPVAEVELCVMPNVSRCTGIDFVALHLVPVGNTPVAIDEYTRTLDVSYRLLTMENPGLAVAVFPVPYRGLGAVRAAALGVAHLSSEVLLLCGGAGTAAADAVTAAAAASGVPLLTLGTSGGVALRIEAAGGAGAEGGGRRGVAVSAGVRFAEAASEVWRDAVRRATSGNSGSQRTSQTQHASTTNHGTRSNRDGASHSNTQAGSSFQSSDSEP